MLRLSTLGGLTLQVDGTPVTGVMTQRRQLALLALLAVARNTGMSRDKILSYLWPEKDAEGARHILNQQLYAQRRMANEDLFVGRKTLRLNPALFETDLWAFEDALRIGRLEDAVDQYRGPFLDGFFLREAGEFDEWTDQQRRRWSREYTEALEQLSCKAEAGGDTDAVVLWRRRALDADPLDGSAALALARALVRRGDRPAAVRALRIHEVKVRKHLEVEPDPEVRRLIAELGS